MKETLLSVFTTLLCMQLPLAFYKLGHVTLQKKNYLTFGLYQIYVKLSHQPSEWKNLIQTANLVLQPKEFLQRAKTELVKRKAIYN